MALKILLFSNKNSDNCLLNFIINEREATLL